MQIQKIEITHNKPLYAFNKANTQTLPLAQNYGNAPSSLYRANLFVVKNNKLSFGQNEKPSQETLNYIELIRKNHAEMGIKSINLRDFDLDRIQDICAGIDVFKDLDAKDLNFLTHNIEEIMLSRGCSHQCVHCGADSSKKITTMNWNNYEDLVNGIAVLKERLGFNPFNTGGNTSIFPFHDAEPMMFISKDNNGNKYNIYDAAKLFYEKTGTKFNITTAGWHHPLSQKAAENFVQDPTCIESISISIHPFHRYYVNYLKNLKQNNPEQANKWKEKYINMMSNVIETTADLGLKIDNYVIDLQCLDKDAELSDYYIKNGFKKTDFDENASRKLLEEIFSRLKRKDIKLSDFSNDINKPGKYGTLFLRKIFNKSGRAGNLIKEERSRPSVFESSNTIIGPAGEIFVNSEEAGNVKLNLSRYHKKLNFKHPTTIKS
ncbi:MAG: hypothetical protein A2Y25_07795 [Candidatus Melainabacteria bacterium GWF2_37_15]|nr:MAG: hypothetical protein A2Y25_07795 [Candidatus Melainabacteria bacterium GWF2_37_15]